MASQSKIERIEAEKASAYALAMELWAKARELQGRSFTKSDARSLEAAIHQAKIADARYWDLSRDLMAMKSKRIEALDAIRSDAKDLISAIDKGLLGVDMPDSAFLESLRESVSKAA